VVLKDIKNIHLSVYPPAGRVRISAPSRMSLDTIRVFAISKLGWIEQRQAKLQGQERETPREHLDRESHYVWDKRYLLKLIELDASYRPRGNDIDLAAHDLFQKPIELRPFVATFGAADAFIGKFTGDDPSLSTANRLGQSLALVVDGLSIFR
jgi:hypothetical protein